MTPADKEWIVLTMEKVGVGIAEKAAEKAIELHVAVCPYGKAVGRSKAFVLGGVFVLTAVGGALGAGVTKFIGMIK